MILIKNLIYINLKNKNCKIELFDNYYFIKKRNVALPQFLTKTQNTYYGKTK